MPAQHLTAGLHQLSLACRPECTGVCTAARTGSIPKAFSQQVLQRGKCSFLLVKQGSQLNRHHQALCVLPHLKKTYRICCKGIFSWICVSFRNISCHKYYFECKRHLYSTTVQLLRQTHCKEHQFYPIC